MPSFCLAGRVFKASGEELEEHELDGLALLRKFTGDTRGDFHAIEQEQRRVDGVRRHHRH